MIKKTTCRKKNQESIFLQLRNILMLFHPAAHTANTITKKTSPWNYTGEDLFPMLVYLSKLFYLADLSAACFILFLQLPQILFGFLFTALFQLLL